MAEEALPDVATWSEIRVTTIFTVATTAAFLVVFEFGRRNPSVAAVFDRRRATRPNRTPPPLIRSRYFEWLFLSCDPAYSAYADRANAREIALAKKRQRRLREGALALAEKLRLPPGVVENATSGYLGRWMGAGGADGALSRSPVAEPIVEEEEPKKKKKRVATTTTTAAAAGEQRRRRDDGRNHRRRHHRHRHQHHHHKRVPTETSAASSSSVINRSSSTVVAPSSSSGREWALSSRSGSQYYKDTPASSARSSPAFSTTSSSGGGFLGETGTFLWTEPSSRRTSMSDTDGAAGAVGGGGSARANAKKDRRGKKKNKKKDKAKGDDENDVDLDELLGSFSDGCSSSSSSSSSSSTDSEEERLMLRSPMSADSEFDDGIRMALPKKFDFRVVDGSSGRRSRSGVDRGARVSSRRSTASSLATTAKADGGVSSSPLQPPPIPVQFEEVGSVALTDEGGGDDWNDADNVVEVNGRRLPASVAELAIEGSLTPEEIDEHERYVVERELFKRRERGQVEDGGDGEEKKEDDDDGAVAAATAAAAAAVAGSKRKRWSGRRNSSGGLSEDGDGAPKPRSRLGYLRTRDLGNVKGVVSRFFFGDGGGGDGDVEEPVGNTARGSSKMAGMFSSFSLRSSRREGGGAGSGGPYDSGSASKIVGGDAGPADDGDGAAAARRRINRQLRSAAVINKRHLSLSDRELLRYVGLDAYVMIRFLRFGFDVTFYPFVLGCIILIPTYYTNPYEGEIATDETDEVVTNGYFRLTMNRLEPGSNRLWVSWTFSILFVCFVLRRLWLEWECFIGLRFDFLANGDAELESDSTDGTVRHKKHSSRLVAPKDDTELHLQQYRNSCLIEHVPISHRRDKELYDFFDAMFPGEVKRAEVLLNANTLTQLIAERQFYIEKYEDTYARHYNQKLKYRKKMEYRNEEDVGFCQYLCCRCFGVAPKQPVDPQVNVSSRSFCRCCCGKKMVKALPFYLSQIKRLNKAVQAEHSRILEEKIKSEDKYYSKKLLKSQVVAQGLKFVTGLDRDLFCSTGFVEFKGLTAKQSALQCNITGTTDFMRCVSAPDPRDVCWENMSVDRSVIKLKLLQCDALLFTGTLFWSVVVFGITSVSNLSKLEQIGLPDFLIPEEGSFLHGLVEGYLPVVMLEVLMLVVTFVVRIIGKNYIRFKTNSEVDRYVFKWHFAYRIANLLIILISGSLYETIKAIQTNPQFFVEKLASGISVQSQFFLNNMIVGAGTETTWELAQMWKMCLHFLIFKFVTVEATSKRKLEKLEEPERFEWGEVMPPFIFAFLVGAVYVTMVPLVIGVCAIFFFISTKVYTHQALFVYAQPYEGGGKLMYLLGRSIFVILYISITIFATVMGLKSAPFRSSSFFFVMMILTLLVDRKIYRTFVQPSGTLALTNARLLDEKNKKKEERERRYQEYRAMKMEKKCQSAIAQAQEMDDEKAATSSTKTLMTTRVVPVGTSLPGLDLGQDGSHHAMPILFRVVKEDTAEQMRQRQAARLSAARGYASQFGIPLDGVKGDSDGMDDNKYDFYLYRQPQLNKSQWETKPRPYR